MTLPGRKGAGLRRIQSSPSRNLYSLMVRKTSQAPNIHLGRSLPGWPQARGGRPNLSLHPTGEGPGVRPCVDCTDALSARYCLRALGAGGAVAVLRGLRAERRNP